MEIPENKLVLDKTIFAYLSWKHTPPKVNIKLLQSTENPSTEHASILEDQHRIITYFADGSKNDLGTDCAVVINPKVLYCYTLPPTFSVFSAELFAILPALQHIYMSKCTFGNICRLSQSLTLKIKETLQNVI